MRVPTAADAEAWFELFADAEVMRFIGDGRVQPLEWYRAFVARQQALAADTGLCLFSLVLDVAGGTTAVAGFAGLQPWTQPWGPTGRTEVGWRLGAAHQGRGLATAAARLCLTRAGARGIHDPVAMIDAGNAVSIAVARKLGMAPESEHTSPTGARVLAFGFGSGGL
ncbi:GNAT family N-acetyltransferase [Subtercola sp. Z020]|nr:GNAT family N-acetyltransferase [Subtercola sp. Z020]